MQQISHVWFHGKEREQAECWEISCSPALKSLKVQRTAGLQEPAGKPRGDQLSERAMDITLLQLHLRGELSDAPRPVTAAEYPWANPLRRSIR